MLPPNVLVINGYFSITHSLPSTIDESACRTLSIGRVRDISQICRISPLFYVLSSLQRHKKSIKPLIFNSLYSYPIKTQYTDVKSVTLL